MRLHLIIIIILALLSALSVRAQSEAYLQMVEQADSALAAGRWGEAVMTLDRAMLMEPENPGNILLLSNKGVALAAMGSDSLAIEALNEAHRRAPVSVTVLLNRGRIEAASGRVIEAYRDFSQVIELDSTLTDPLFYRALIAMQLGDLETAARDLDRMAELAPDLPDTHLGHAAFYTAMGEPSEAISEFTWLIDREPTAGLYTERASLYLELDELAEASADIAEGLALEPDDPELYLQRAVLNRKRYRPDDARADVRRAMELGVPAERIRALGLDK